MWFVPVLVILVIYFFVRNSRQTKIEPDTDTPLDLLKKQYAGGKIDKEQFEQMKKDVS